MEEVCGMSFIHGEAIHMGIDCMAASVRVILDALEDFGFDAPDTRWTPYFRNPRSPYPDGVAVSTWEREGQILLAIFNPE